MTQSKQQRRLSHSRLLLLVLDPLLRLALFFSPSSSTHALVPLQTAAEIPLSVTLNRVHPPEQLPLPEIGQAAHCGSEVDLELKAFFQREQIACAEAGLSDRELNVLKSTSGPSCICKSLLLHPRYVTHYAPTYNLKLSIIVFILSVLSLASLSKKYQSITVNSMVKVVYSITIL